MGAERRLVRPSRPSRGLAGHDDRDHELVALGVGEPDDVRLLDARMRHQHLLHLDRGDVDAPGLDHLLEAPPEMEPAGLVEVAEVAGEEPALVVERLPVLVLRPVVAAGDVAADLDLADLAGGEWPPRLRILDGELEPGEGPPHRDRPQLERIVRVGDRAVRVGLGEAIDVADLARAEIGEEADLLRGADGDPGAKRREPLRPEARVLGDRPHHVRGGVHHGAALALDEVDRLARLEPLLEDDGAGVGHEREESVLAAEAPEERYREPEPVPGEKVHPLADAPHVLDEGVVLELDALRGRGGPRGVEDAGDVRRLDGRLRHIDHAFRNRLAGLHDRLPRNPAPHLAAVRRDPDHVAKLRQLPGRVRLADRPRVVLAEEPVHGDEHARLGVVEHVRELAPRRPGVERDHDRAEREDREVRDQPLRPVAHEDRDLVAAAHPEGVEPPREAARLGPELRVGEAPAAADHELDVRMAGRELLEQAGDGPGAGHRDRRAAGAGGVAARKGGGAHAGRPGKREPRFPRARPPRRPPGVGRRLRRHSAPIARASSSVSMSRASDRMSGRIDTHTLRRG